MDKSAERMRHLRHIARLFHRLVSIHEPIIHPAKHIRRIQGAIESTPWRALVYELKERDAPCFSLDPLLFYDASVP